MKNILFTGLIYLALVSQSSQAVDKNWVCDNDSWDNPACWSPTQPLHGDDAYLTLIQTDEVDRIVTYSNNINPVLDLNSLTINATGSGTMTLSQSQDSFAATTEYIGYDGTGTYTQTGGDNIVNDLYLGYLETGNGTYNLSGTGSLLADNETISRHGSGTFNQTGGTNEANFIAIASAAGSDASGTTGTYNLSGGSLSVDNMEIASSGFPGSFATGVFNQSGGSVTVSNRLNLADLRGASGTYNLSEGSLEAGELGLWDVDQTGKTGVFNQTGGTVITNRVVSTFPNFTYNLDEGSLTTNTIDLQTGGQFNQTGGVLDATSITVESGSTFNFDGGTLAVDNFTGNLVNNGGTLAPGESPGTTHINGDYTQVSDGIFEVEIGGLQQGSEYDWLNITGNAALGGTLDVDLFDLGSGSFTLGEDDVFDILSAESITGEFDLLTLAALGEGLEWDVSYHTDFSGTTDLVRLTINTVNVLPTANAGIDQIVSESAAVNLNGNLSSDSDGSITSYSWTQTAGTAVTVSGANTATPSFTAPSVISDTLLMFSLVVTDNNGDTDTASVTIAVTNMLVVDAGTDQQITEGDIVQLNGLNSLDVSDIVVAYQWVQTEGPAVILDDSSSATPSFIAPAVDITTLLVFKMIVSDSNGLQDYDTTFVNVRDELLTGIAPPLDVQLIDTVVSGNVFYQFETMSVPFFASTNVQWNQSNGPAVTLDDANTAIPSFMTPAVSVDSATTFQVRSTNIDGLIVRADVDVNILGPASVNPAPIANAGNGQVVTEGDTVDLDATASTDDGSIVSYYWQQTGGPMAMLTSIMQAQTSFVAPAIAAVDDGTELTFELAVTDDGGFVDRQSVTITILDNGITAFADDVTVILSSSGDPIGIQTINDGSLVALEAVDPDTIVDEVNRPDFLPYGLLDFSLRVEPGATIQLSIALPSPAVTNLTWWKYVNGSGWLDYSADTTFNVARDVMTITLTDNGIGDDDPTLGVIRDPGGLALASAPTTDGSSTSSGGGGGSIGPLLLVFLLLGFIARTYARVHYMDQTPFSHD